MRDSEQARSNTAEFWNGVAQLVAAGKEIYPGDAGYSWTELSNDVEWQAATCFDNKSAILELGCGPGFTVEWAALRCGRVIGVDFSIEQLRLARNRTQRLRNVSLICHDLNNDLPGRIDAVTHCLSIFGAFDFVQAPGKLLDQCFAVLSPGGFLVIVSSRLDLFSDLSHSLTYKRIVGQARSEPHCLMVLRQDT